MADITYVRLSEACVFLAVILEEVNGKDYRDLADARARIGDFIEATYNRHRLHSALRSFPRGVRTKQLIHRPVDGGPAAHSHNNRCA